MGNEFYWRIKINALWQFNFDGKEGKSCCTWSYCPYKAKKQMEKNITLAAIYKEVDEKNLPDSIIWRSTDPKNQKFGKILVDVRLHAVWEEIDDDPACSRLQKFKILLVDHQSEEFERGERVLFIDLLVKKESSTLLHEIEIVDGGEWVEGGCFFDLRTK